MQILAPAGDFERLRAAVFSGADCVYVGVNGFNARRSAANLDAEALKAAVGFCHARNCSVYAALNILVLPGEEARLAQAVEDVAEAGCDGVIVQDLMTAETVGSLAPHLPMHASTQMSVHSLAGVEKLAELGFSRVILARELREAEIAHIARRSPIELEVFIHGALCFSVSGQCHMSAFIGGRSANRGACAAPCRLPFTALEVAQPGGKGKTGKPAGKTPPSGESYALSLKDLSILDALPRLAQMGIASGKIEGRLRRPEYVAVAVDSARKALEGKPYDKERLENAFSRSGFTCGWFGEDSDMFGVRTEEDALASKQALAAAHELYRREAPRVPVCMELALTPGGARLKVSDGENTAEKQAPGPLPQADKDQVNALRAALEKTGGTPFYVKKKSDIAITAEDVFLPASSAAALRREALAELLEKRENAAEAGKGQRLGQQANADNEWCHIPGQSCGVLNHSRPALLGHVGASTRAALASLANKKASLKNTADAVVSASVREKKLPAGSRPVWHTRFETLRQMPEDIFSLCDEVILPLAQAGEVAPGNRRKTWLWLPRVLFGCHEEEAQKAIEKTSAMGFRGYEVNNLAHLKLCEGLPMRAGLGLNCTNRVAAQRLAAEGCEEILLSPELSLRQAEDILNAAQQTPCETAPAPLPFDTMVYGHVPLMVTRACPLKRRAGCAGCKKNGVLRDRKGQEFVFTCENDVRTIYNSLPLWMADKPADVHTQGLTLYFTREAPAQVKQILTAYKAENAAPGDFTRGLYYRGVEK